MKKPLKVIAAILIALALGGAGCVMWCERLPGMTRPCSPIAPGQPHKVDRIPRPMGCNY